MSGPLTYLAIILYTIPGFVIGSVIHELGHAAVAQRCGDPTPRREHRMTLDPRRQLDPFGVTAMVIAGIGWGKPVPLDPFHLRSGRQRAAVAAAGPLAHLLVAAVFAIALRVELLGSGIDVSGFLTLAQLTVQGVLLGVLLQGFLVNVALFIFNALPLPGLDGYAVLRSLAFTSRPRWFLWMEQYRHALYVAVIAFAIVLPHVTGGGVNPLVAVTTGSADVAFSHLVVPGMDPNFIGLPNLFTVTS